MAKTKNANDQLTFKIASMVCNTFPMDMTMPVFFHRDEGEYYVVLGCGWNSAEDDNPVVDHVLQSDDYCDRIVAQTRLKDTKGFKLAKIKTGTPMASFVEIDSNDDRDYFAMKITKDLFI